jgi:hypothetical protein
MGLYGSNEPELDLKRLINQSANPFSRLFELCFIYMIEYGLKIFGSVTFLIKTYSPTGVTLAPGHIKPVEFPLTSSLLLFFTSRLLCKGRKVREYLFLP